MNIVDRRSNPGGRSLPNRQRFLGRTRKQLQEAVRDAATKGRVEEIGKDGSVSIPTGGIQEPTFHHGTGGAHERVLPGNKEFEEGDTIARPEKNKGKGSAGSSGGGKDEFQFVLSQEEFLNIFFEDLELPDLVKRTIKQTSATQSVRAGFSTSGSPSNLNLSRTMRNSWMRRIALHRPKLGEVAELEQCIADMEAQGYAEDVIEALRAELEIARRRMLRIPYIDPVDVRYNRFQQIPKPAAQAVMFCVMDVSGSMDENLKDLAKRFFILLHLFLVRQYKEVDIVFIRHTEEAKEVGEKEFFYSKESGGTVVSTALELMRDIIKERYPVEDWNIYVAQASDGDNDSSDRKKIAPLLEDSILPTCQYFVYVEVSKDPGRSLPRTTELWQKYYEVSQRNNLLVMRRAHAAREIFTVFRDLFSPKVSRR